MLHSILSTKAARDQVRKGLGSLNSRRGQTAACAHQARAAKKREMQDPGCQRFPATVRKSEPGTSLPHRVASVLDHAHGRTGNRREAQINRPPRGVLSPTAAQHAHAADPRSAAGPGAPGPSAPWLRHGATVWAGPGTPSAALCVLMLEMVVPATGTKRAAAQGRSPSTASAMAALAAARGRQQTVGCMCPARSWACSRRRPFQCGQQQKSEAYASFLSVLAPRAPPQTAQRKGWSGQPWLLTAHEKKKKRNKNCSDAE